MFGIEHSKNSKTPVHEKPHENVLQNSPEQEHFLNS